MFNVNSHGRTLRIVVVLLLISPVLVLAAQPVAAAPDKNGNGGGSSASGYATQMCNSTGWTLLLAIVYLAIALAFIGLVSGGAVGAGLISFGWIGRTIGNIAKEMITGSFVGGVLFLLILTFVGIVIANVPIPIPKECVSLLR